MEGALESLLGQPLGGLNLDQNSILKMNFELHIGQPCLGNYDFKCLKGWP